MAALPSFTNTQAIDPTLSPILSQTPKDANPLLGLGMGYGGQSRHQEKAENPTTPAGAAAQGAAGYSEPTWQERVLNHALMKMGPNYKVSGRDRVNGPAGGKGNILGVNTKNLSPDQLRAALTEKIAGMTEEQGKAFLEGRSGQAFSNLRSREEVARRNAEYAQNAKPAAPPQAPTPSTPPAPAPEVNIEKVAGHTFDDYPAAPSRDRPTISAPEPKTATTQAAPMKQPLPPVSKQPRTPPMTQAPIAQQQSAAPSTPPPFVGPPQPQTNPPQALSQPPKQQPSLLRKAVETVTPSGYEGTLTRAGLGMAGTLIKDKVVGPTRTGVEKAGTFIDSTAAKVGEAAKQFQNPFSMTGVRPQGQAKATPSNAQAPTPMPAQNLSQPPREKPQFNPPERQVPTGWKGKSYAKY